MRAEALKGHLDGLLLAALEGQPRHGYAVIQELHARSGGAVELPTGTVYPALHRLERAGLLGSDWTRSGGRRRRVYFLTSAGRRALGTERDRWAEFVNVLGGVLNAPTLPGHVGA
ncbi:MAG: helix-turn-helix transcriptional regulator [Pseudonocardia sp.]|nr:helix-turn-helix transcriptional regulator [Pseudonocardia sp.]